MTKISADTNGRGRFITFEGIDGAGKTSQIDACEAFLREKGIRVVRTREPGVPFSEKKSGRCCLRMTWCP